MRLLAIFSITLLFLSSGLSAAVWYIKADGSGDEPTIQAGIDACAEGDTVMLAPGIYTGIGNREISFNGKDVVITSEILIDPMAAGPAVIDCELSGSGFYLHDQETLSSVIQGLVIQNAGSLVPSAEYGGIFCDLQASPTISRNVIQFTECSNGGGIRCTDGASPYIVNNTIESGVSTFGGTGIFCENSSAIIDSNIVRNNMSTSYSANGAGIYCYDSYVTISGNEVYGNIGEWGSGITIEYGEAYIENNSVYDNSNEGVRCGGAIVIIRDNTISGNRRLTYAAGGSAICCFSCGSKIQYNEIFDNEGTGGVYTIYIDGGSETKIEDNSILNNIGGGIHFIGDPASTISGNTIFNNDDGSGIVCESSVTITGNVICDQTITTISAWPLMGAGIAVLSCSPVIVGNTVADNDVGPGEGPGIACENSNVDLQNNIVANNSYGEAFGTGGGIYSSSSSINVSCCNVYGNEGGEYVGMADQTGTNGNISVDPYFCDPSNADYSLQADSRCLPGLHPDGWSCGLIGALGVGCAFCEPIILSIVDVENDQGCQVSISWSRSLWDEYGTSYPIINYEIYRRIDELPVHESGSEQDDLPIHLSDKDYSIPGYPPGDWHYVLDVAAHGEDLYNVVVPTLEDSCAYNDTTATGEKLYYSTFFVRAATAAPTLYCDSAVDSGYSVDNLSPSVPGDVSVAYNTGGGNVISWDESPNDDFDNFRIYRGVDENFVPSPDNLVHVTIETGWTDTVEDGWKYTYKITAMDFNGNESEPGLLTVTTGIETSELPQSYTLYQNVPNPFNPVTTISFDLPRATHVKLCVYNIKGELVSTVADRKMSEGRKEFVWTAVDRRGRAVASGIYFYRLVAGDFVQTKKMVLLR